MGKIQMKQYEQYNLKTGKLQMPPVPAIVKTIQSLLEQQFAKLR